MAKSYTYRVVRASGHYTKRVCYTPMRVFTLPFMELNEEKYRAETGKRLQAARKRAGLTQESAASHIATVTKEECPPSRISNYEQGTRLVPPITLQLLCDLYDASPSEIYGFSDGLKDQREKAIVAIYRDTDDRGKKAIQSVADAQPVHLVTPSTRERTGNY